MTTTPSPPPSPVEERNVSNAHTPGPWIARPDTNGRPDDYMIGLDDDCSPPDYVAVCSRRDARLIAAAPELLGFARWIAERHDDKSVEGIAARTFIAKATGKAP
jgi:hypothetical protein